MTLSTTYSEQPSSSPSSSPGKERDAEDGLDYFGARYYSSAMGRFMSPDWSSRPEGVPYAQLDNPQSLNLYGYVGNDPADRVDPDGHMMTLAEEQASWGDLGDESAVSSLLQSQSDADLAEVQAALTNQQNDEKPAAQQAQQQNVNNDAVGKTTVGSLSKVLTNEIGSLGTPKGGDPKQLQNGANAIANALINNANRKRPNKVAPDTGTASSPLSQIMQDAYTNRANGGADPVGGRTFYGTSHIPPSRLHSRPIGRGRQSVYESFGPFNDSWSHQTTWIYIYNDPGH